MGKLNDPKLVACLDAAMPVSVQRIAPFPSLYLARCAVQNEFPHHTKRVRKVRPEKAGALLEAYREKLGQIRRASLELASLETDLKLLIGFDEGIEVPGVGILYWTSSQPSGKSHRGRVNWLKLCADKGISEDELKRYKKDDTGQRRFFLRRKVRTVEGIENLGGAPKEDVELDDEF